MENLFPVMLTFTISKDKIDFIKEELVKTIEPTRLEKGCIMCDYYQDIEQTNFFIINEIWIDNVTWQNHMLSDHIKKFLEITTGCKIDLSIHQLEKLA